MKICSKKDCILDGKSQSLDSFGKDKNTKDGLFPQCKTCISKYHKEHYQKNSKSLKEYQKKYQETNTDKISQRRKRYYEENKQEIRKCSKNYYQNHRIQRYEYCKQKILNDIQFRLESNLRSRLRMALKKNYKSGSAVADLMMSISDFKIYLEERFYPNPDTGEAMS